MIEDQTQTALEGLVDSFVINWVWMPPWGMEKITDDGRDQLRALGFQRLRVLDSRSGWADGRARKRGGAVRSQAQPSALQDSGILGFYARPSAHPELTSDVAPVERGWERAAAVIGSSGSRLRDWLTRLRG